MESVSVSWEGESMDVIASNESIAGPRARQRKEGGAEELEKPECDDEDEHENGETNDEDGGDDDKEDNDCDEEEREEAARCDRFVKLPLTPAHWAGGDVKTK